MLIDLISKNRSYRRFYQNEKIDRAVLEELVELARLSPSARNAQPLKFFLSMRYEDEIQTLYNTYVPKVPCDEGIHEFARQGIW